MLGNVGNVRVIVALTAAGLILSLGSLLYFTSQNLVLAYPDAQSHLVIARRVCDSSSPGLAQLGAVWLPLTHLLSLPFVCSDVWSTTWWGNAALVVAIALFMTYTRYRLSQRSAVLRILSTIGVGFIGVLFALSLHTNAYYTSGLGMVWISMLAYVFAGVFIYLVVYEMTKDPWAGVVAWAVFATNPNILYLQSTAMTELPLYFGVMFSIYSFRRLVMEPSRLKWLFINGVAGVVMTTVRYEGWTLLAGEAAVYGFILLRNKLSISGILGHMLQWGYLAFAGIVGWIIWNTTIFSNPFEFQTGSYAKPSNWVSGTEAGVGNLRIAAETYGYGMLHTIGIILVLAIVALVIYVLTTRLKKESLAVLLPLGMVPFFVYMIFKGQRPMQALELEGTIYNARFALIIILSVAPLIGFAVRKSPALKVATIVLLGVSTLVMLNSNVGIITLTEPLRAAESESNTSQLEVAEFLREHYNNESMLMENYGNEQVQFLSGINLQEIIYEGTYRLWQPVLNAPYANNIQWILMRGSEGGSISSLQPDLVWTTVREQQSFWDHYELVFKNDFYEVYRLKAE